MFKILQSYKTVECFNISQKLLNKHLKKKTIFTNTEDLDIIISKLT